MAIAVLGREAEIDVIRQVCAVPDDELPETLDELTRRQVLEPLGPGILRFVHDKLREVSYSRAPAETVLGLHERAAITLEAKARDHPDQRRMWATLGYHFSAAKQSRAAARYLRLAADHARSTYANGDALRLYREAMRHVELLLSNEEDASPALTDTSIVLQESLADVLALTGQRDEARINYELALERTKVESVVTRARLYRKLGKTWETQHEHEQSLRYYLLAKSALPGAPADKDEERNEWIQVRIDELWVYYWLSRVPEMDALSSSLRPVLDQGASPVQRARFFDTQMKRNLRRDRFVIREETLGFVRAAVSACEGEGGAADLPMQKFNFGFVLLFHNSLDAADEELKTALALAERAGDASLQARCLAYLGVCARVRGRVRETAEYSDDAEQASRAAGMLEYVATAFGNRAWVAIRQGNLERARALAEQAVSMWNGLHLVFPFQWTALVPLLEAALAQQDLECAVRCAEALLSPKQQCLPGLATDSLARAVASFHADAAAAVRALELAIRYLDPQWIEGAGRRQE